MNNFTVGIIQSLLGSRQVEYIEQYITIGGMVTSLRFLLSSAIAMTVLSRCAITISSIALLPSQMVGYNLPRLKELRDDFIAKHQVEKDIYEVSIEVKKQIELNALVVKSKSKNFPSWMLYLNANGMVYEDVLRSANDLADSLNRNLILVNFRGVGKSQGKSEKALHLVEDCIACLNYLKNLGIKEENILIWGHSIGALVNVIPTTNILIITTRRSSGDCCGKSRQPQRSSVRRSNVSNAGGGDQGEDSGRPHCAHLRRFTWNSILLRVRFRSLV